MLPIPVTRNSHINIARWILAIVLIFALGSMHPSYYMFLRVVVTIISLFLAYKAYEENNAAWMWCFGIIALLYNPFFPVYFRDKNIWSFFNILVVVVAFIATRNISEFVYDEDVLEPEDKPTSNDSQSSAEYGQKTRTHYDNLQVVENASIEVIKGAYKFLSQKYHPDKYPEDRAKAESIMKMINTAYTVLSDPEKRKEHDEWIASRAMEYEVIIDEPAIDGVFASLEVRFQAYVVDTAITMAVFFAIIFSINNSYPHLLTADQFRNTSALLFAIFNITYSTFFEASVYQATPGKMLANIKVANSHGRPIGLFRSFWRQISKNISASIFFIGFFVANLSVKRRSLHDTIAGTLVVDRRFSASEIRNGVGIAKKDPDSYISYAFSLIVYFLIALFLILEHDKEDFVNVAFDAMSEAEFAKKQVAAYYEITGSTCTSNYECQISNENIYVDEKTRLTLYISNNRIFWPIEETLIYEAFINNRHELTWTCKNGTLPNKYRAANCLP